MSMTLSRSMSATRADVTNLIGISLPYVGTAPRNQSARLTDAEAVVVPVSRADVAEAPILLSEEGSIRFHAVMSAGRAPLAEPSLDLGAF
jgi:hypothetical protein